ncbi:MAG: hypothetical protein D4S01_05540 [Dehalococcoidia bacterium]|nr:MAG: hypothetical protein D4S01_05540 [Dehalococcoidia bacterium]
MFADLVENIVIEVFARRPDQVKSIELKGQINGQAWSNKILMAGTSLLGGTLEMKGKLLKRSKNFGLLAKDLQRCYESIVAVKNV